MNKRQITFAPDEHSDDDEVDEQTTDLSVMSILHLRHEPSSTILRFQLCSIEWLCMTVTESLAVRS